MPDVTAIGELLIDFTPAGKSVTGQMLYEQNPGGAPANVLAMLAKLGRKTAFIGKVGNDLFGHMLEKTLEQCGILTEGLIKSDEHPTTLAFVHLGLDGEREFSFYRKHSADQRLTVKELPLSLIAESKVLHFGSVSLTNDPAAEATLKAVAYAKLHGVRVSYDPNLRLPLWDNKKRAKKMICEGLRYADILKISEEELQFITGDQALAEGTEQLRREYDIPLIFVTRGAKGCFLRKGERTAEVKSFPVQAVDTTGAGDSFTGAVLHGLLQYDLPLEEITLEQIISIATYANAAGALTATKRGGLLAVPTHDEIEQFIAQS